MSFFRLVLFVIVSPLLIAAHAQAATTPPAAPQFAHEHSDLAADPAVRFGKLENGLHYAVLANAEPRTRASLRLVVLAGSFHETEGQRGLAHFLEHMAFNGSTHYAPGTLVEYFQRMGMSFGGDTNAYTSFDHTTYMLELPDTHAHTLEEGFKVFSDYAGGLLLSPQEIDRERGIILAEKRTRDSVEYRQMLAEFDFVLGDTLLPKRVPIGLESVIAEASRETFVDFYDAWYRPERMAVIAVGDFDAAAVEQQIIAAFAKLTPRGPARPSPALGAIARFEGVRARHHHEPEAGATTVAIQTAMPLAPEPDTAAKRLRALPRELAVAMLQRRLDILAKRDGAPFSRAHVAVNDAFQFFRNAVVELTGQPAHWSAALTVAEQELRRALEHGFQSAELQEARANLLNELTQAARTAATRRSDALAAALVSALVDGDVFTTPTADLALYQPALEKISVNDCVAALREAFATKGRFVSVMGNAPLKSDTLIAETYQAARASAVAPPEKIAETAFAYTDFGIPGKITAQKHVADLDLELVTFANDVRLNLKKTDFEAGQIRVSVRIGGGRLTEPREQPGLGAFAETALVTGGLGRHSVDDLQRVLAGKTLSAGFRVAPDAFTFSTTTNRDDLLLQLQLLAAYVTDPGWRPEAQRTTQKTFDQLYTRLAHRPDGPLQTEVPRRLANGDPRFGLPPRETLLARTLAEARAWLAPQFAAGPIEIALVGDLDPAAARDAVAQTFGALPPRAPKPAYEAERRAAFPEKTTTWSFTVPTEIPKGFVALYWPTTDARDITLVRRLSVLAEILGDRLRVKIREELGDAYSPEAASAPSEAYRDYGFMSALVAVDPAKADAVIAAALALADDLAAHGVTEDELVRAKKPILTGIREAARSNAYWLQSVLGSAQEMPQRLDWRRSIERDFAAISKPELDEIAKRFLPSIRAFRVQSLPATNPPAN
jgi:zinc protease